ncbi:beta strand repeat-containing protein, partial [Herminiimonas sp.]|uniref:beta strand repeat-containing protein n=1 Tax=Herminiimonas sp. TaxID=1926289 RepID=UPI00271A00C3|nr:hypothetical protein [Herminiimonas sp.]
NTLAANLSNGTLRFANNQNLNIGTVNGVNGVTNTAGTTQFYLDGGGQTLTLAQNVNSSNVYLRANGGVNQTGGTITANTLALAGGAATLNQAGNNVNTLAANINGALSYTDTNRVTIGSASGINGITTSNHDVTLTTGDSSGYDPSKQPDASNLASLILNESINAGSGNVRLTTGSGGAFQRHDTDASGALLANGSITANALLLKGSSASKVTPFVLTNAANRINTLAASANGSISFAGAGNSSTTVTVGSIDGINGINTTSNTVVSTTNNADGSITSSTNENNVSISIGGNLNIDQNITASTASGTDTVSLGIGGDFTARTASGIKVTADTLGVFGDDNKGTFNIVSDVANLAAAGGKLMVIDNSQHVGDLTGIGIGAPAAAASATNGGNSVNVNSASRPVGDFYLTTSGGLNIIKLMSQGSNLMLRSSSLNILLDAVTADGARIMLQPYNLASKVGINNSSEAGFATDINYDAATLLKFTNPTSTFFFGTPQNVILQDANVPAAAKNTLTGDVHIGYDGAFNLGYRSLSAQTSGNMIAYNVGPLYNLRLAAPNLTINSFSTFGPQMHFFSNNLSLPGSASAYVNPNKPEITLRSLNNHTMWIGNLGAGYENAISPQTIVKMPDGSTIIISGSTDYAFPEAGSTGGYDANGNKIYGDIHIPWNSGLVLLGNRKLILSTGKGLYTYNPTPIYTSKNDGGTSGGLWQGCLNLTDCMGTNPSPFPNPDPPGGGTGNDDSNPGTSSGGCQGCPPAPPNTNPYPPETTPSDGNGNPGNDDNNNNNDSNNDNTNTDNNGDGNNNDDTGNNDNTNNDDGGDNNNGGHDNSKTDSGGTSDGDNNDNGNNGDGDGTGDGDNGPRNGSGGNSTSDNGDGTSGDLNGGDSDGNGDGASDGNDGGNNGGGDGNGDRGAGTGSGGTGDGDGSNGAGDGDGNNGGRDGGDGSGDGSGGNGSGDSNDGSGDGGAGNGSGGTSNGADNSGNGATGSGNGGAGDGKGGNGNGDSSGGKGTGDGNGESGDAGSDTDSGDTADGKSSAQSPAFDISCQDVSASRQEAATAGNQNAKRNLVEVKREGLKLRDPCQQQAPQNSKR